MVYELMDPGVAQLVESLTLVAGGVPARVVKSPSLVKARTCYDHLAGRLGVAIFDSLVAGDVIEKPGPLETTVNLGRMAPEMLGRLGIDMASLRGGRRRLATACLDWTERRPHLGGALGAALCACLMEQGWVLRQRGTRAVIVTEAGKQALLEHLGAAFGPPFP